MDWGEEIMIEFLFIGELVFQSVFIVNLYSCKVSLYLIYLTFFLIIR